MDARAVSIRELLVPRDASGHERPVQLRVPVFQRAYEWRADTIERLVRDVLDRLDGDPDTPPHFLGSFVLLDEPELPGQPDAAMIIDGQQRLLTMAVMLARCERHLGGERVLENPGQGVIGRPRIVPADVDHADFKAITSGADPTGDRALQRAVSVVDRLTADRDPAVLRDGILDRVQVVRILLDRREDAEAVFESLNTAGQPLTQADLIRTALLAAFRTVEDQRTIDGLYWRPTEERLRALVHDRARYERESPKDRVVGDYLRSFLMRDGGRVDAARMYRWFAERYDRSEAQADETLAAFERLSHAYAALMPPPPASPRDQSPHHVLRRLGYNVHHPLLLQLAERAAPPSPAFPPDDIPLVVAGLESFFIRRAAVGWPTNILGRLFERLCADRPPDRHAVWRALEPHWPSDARFARGLIDQPIYLTSRSAALVMLGRLDIAQNEKDSTLDDEASVEHVMPQAVGEDARGMSWRAMLGPDWEQIHARRLHTLPNLTVTRRNPEMSNRSFTEKRAWFADSKFATNRSIGRLAAWDEVAMTSRGEAAVSLALRLWPLPDGIVGYRSPEEIAADAGPPTS